MARYLLVEFDDNDSADRMRAQIDSAEANGKRFRVIGMFTKAGTLCDCSDRSERSIMGARFKWWICPQCKKPRPGSSQNLRNILDAAGTPAKYLELMLCVRWLWKDGRVVTARSRPPKDWK